MLIPPVEIGETAPSPDNNGAIVSASSVELVAAVALAEKENCCSAIGQLSEETVAELDRWVLEAVDDEERRCRLEAKKRIIACTFSSFWVSRTLDLRGLWLSSLPDIFDDPFLQEHLYVLIVVENRLAELPKSFFTLKKLKSLDLSGNRMKRLPYLRTIIDLNFSCQSVRVNLNDVQLPPELERLDLSTCGLTTLPSLPSSLKTLKCSSNPLENLPDEIGELKELELLDIFQIQATELPDSLGDLLKLKKLNCGGNKLTTLPSTLGKLKELRELSLRGNRELSELPAELRGCLELSEIETTWTNISNVEEILRELKVLREIRGLKDWAESESEFDFMSRWQDDDRQRCVAWLDKLKSAHDFQNSQDALKKMVRQILLSTESSEKFRVAFFELLTNVHYEPTGNCGNRAGKLYSLIHLSWHLHSLSGETSIQDRLQVMIRAAKYAVLERAVARRFSQEDDLVEKQRLFEVHFKDQILSPLPVEPSEERIESYPKEVRQFQREMEEKYLDELVEMPQLCKLLEDEGVGSFNRARWQRRIDRKEDETLGVDFKVAEREWLKSQVKSVLRKRKESG